MNLVELNYKSEFASDVMTSIPYGNIDKTICGCGLTTVALENSENTIIAVPTIYLAINKSVQYPNDRCDNKILAVWGETKQEDIDAYLSTTSVVKIMVTYDSLPKVEYLLDTCRLVIDESNELLSKTKLKPQVIYKVFSIAERYRDTVSFISATPNPLHYMPKWISEINQVKINWEQTIKAKPILCERTYPFKSLREEFIKPLKDNGSITVADKTFSKVIVFINSVSQIAEVVKDSGLDKNDCGIICGDSLKNDVKIIGITRYTSGNMPKYLFITSTGFCGIDLYDDTAMTIVVSNTNKQWQMIDMLTDLKQAVSRQRNKNNPNYGSYIYIYNQSVFNNTENDLMSMLDSTYLKINKSIRIYDMAVASGDEDGFVPYPDFTAYTIFKDNRYEINEQAFQADKYFILEIRNQYTRGFDIKGGLDSSVEIEPVELPNNISYKDLVEHFKENNIDGVVNWGVYSTKTNWISIIESSYKFYKKVWTDFTYARDMVENYGDEFELIKVEIKSMFKKGERYKRSDITTTLQAYYNHKGISRKAKYSDLSEIMDYKDITIRGIRMVEILK